MSVLNVFLTEETSYKSVNYPDDSLYSAVVTFATMMSS